MLFFFFVLVGLFSLGKKGCVTYTCWTKIWLAFRWWELALLVGDGSRHTIASRFVFLNLFVYERMSEWRWRVEGRG
jgi:hypothetical protein